MPAPEHVLADDAEFSASYELLEELGRGAFGQVHRARQRSTGRDVAVKTVRIWGGPETRDVTVPVDRFRRELRVCAELAHPNVVRLIDSGETAGGYLFAVFEYVPGATLESVLASEGRLSVREAAHLMSQVLDALSCAHAHGVVHRDLTPSNIMVSRTGVRRNALVLDFGLGGFVSDALRSLATSLTERGEFVGTPSYAAPEQLRGLPPCPASDLYSWGLILLECVTGERPFAGASIQDVVYRQLGPEPVAIPRWLASKPLGQLIAQVVAKPLARRATDVEQLLDGLTRIAAGAAPEPRSGARATVAERVRRQVTITCCRVSLTPDGDQPIDVEELDQLLRMQRSAFSQAAASAGALVAAVLADRLFLVHGYPHAHEDDGRRAARLALQIVGRGISGTMPLLQRRVRASIHAGVHTGLLIVPDDDGDATGLELTGITPQIASRLADLAAPGEVLVSADTHLVLRGQLAAAPAGECALGELSRPMRTYRLIEQGVGGTDDGRTTTPRTPLIGRARELDLLREAWRAAQRRAPSTVLVTGEAGLGKSRLLRELRGGVDRNAWYGIECVPEGRTAPLRAISDSLALAAGGLEALLVEAGMSQASEASLLRALVDPSREVPAAFTLTADRRKQLTLDALVGLFFGLAAERAIVLVVENLHWADPTTLDLLTQLTQELRACRLGDPAGAPMIALVVTTRPEFSPAWSGEDFSFLPLQRLSSPEVEELVRVGRGGHAPPSQSLVAAVVERAEGIPLFAEELARLVFERADDPAALPTASRQQRIPASLRDLLTARLDGVSSRARETAHLAAVLGREFTFDLLRAVSGMAESGLRDVLAELGDAGLVFRRRAGAADSYLFRHALLRDAAYDALSRNVRQGVHRRVADTLESETPELARRRPELVALHREEGGEHERATRRWLEAGMQSYRRAAYVEALQQLERGVALLSGLERTPDVTALEVDLLSAYGTALLSLRGWADPEVEATFVRALDLARGLGGDPPLMVLYGLWGVIILRSDRARIEPFLAVLRDLAGRVENRVVQHFCLSILGIAAFWAGDVPQANALLGRALDAYDEADSAAGYDGGLYTYAFGFCSSWSVGAVARAIELREQGFAVARRRKDPYSMAVILAFATMLAVDCGDGEAAIEYGGQLMTLSSEQNLFAFSAPGMVGYGGGLIACGKVEEGLRFVRDGLERYRMLGIMASYSYYQSYLARGLLAAGRSQEALDAIAEGLGLCDTLHARLHESELWRLRAEALAQLDDVTGAHDAARRAVEIAHQRGAGALELRAATTLASLARGTAEEAAARTKLETLCGSFADGAEMHDVQTARALLADTTGQARAARAGVLAH
jgi:TOMM system kinase/cyclase fusion protein